MRFLSPPRPLRTHSPRLRLEALSDRACPSCATGQIGDTLFITGDRLDNRIDISQIGDSVQVACDGGEAQSFRGVKHIAVNTWAGNDAVTANFSQPPEPDFTFRAELGLGNDTFTATFFPTETIAPAGHIQLDVFGQQDNDRMSLFIGDPGISPLSHLNSAIAINLDGGGGDDSFQATFNPTESVLPPEVPMRLQLDAFGRDGNDTFDISIGDPGISPQPHLFTALTANFDGGGGDNTALFEVQNVVVDAPMSLTYIGGPGDEVLGWDWRDVTVNAAVTQKVNLGGGDDNATIIYQNVAFDAPVTQTMDFGGGSDVAALNAYNVAFNADAVTNVDLGGGGDNAIIVHFNVAFNADAVTNVMGGDGGETVGIVIDGINVAAGASAKFDVDGGGGRDVISADVIGSKVARDGVLDIEFHGGVGADVLRASTAGLLVEADGQFSLCFEGNGGNDVISARLDFDHNSHGTVNAELMGDAGDDLLVFRAVGIGDPNQFTALVDGGAGFDIAFVSRGIDVRDCEVIAII
jgi:hypothetical protein